MAQKKQKEAKLLCPGLRYMMKPLTYRICQCEIIPNMGCCDKCIAWPIDANAKSHLANIASQLSQNASANPVQQQALLSDFANKRISAHYKTLQTMIEKAFTEALQRGDHGMIEKIMQPIANHYGDVDIDNVIDAGYDDLDTDPIVE